MPRTLQLPEERETFALTTLDGAHFSLRVHGPGDRPRLVLSHGNGFAIDGYLPFWRHLLCDFELVLFDFRNHGRNPFHGPGGHDWPTFVEDFEQILQSVQARLGAKPTAGIFHSLSAITSLMHAVKFGWRWEALVLFEPPILPPLSHPLRQEARAGETRVAEWAQQRPDRFKDPEELALQWQGKPAFRNWVPGAHHLMAESILRRDPRTGLWGLCCPRALEAKIYRENVHPALWGQLSQLPGPVLIAGGDPTQGTGGITAKIARTIAESFGFAYAAIPNTTHLLMIEEPARCAETAVAFLDRVGFLAA